MRPTLALCACAAAGLLCWLPLAAAQDPVQAIVVCRSGPTPSGASPILVGASAALDCCSSNAPFGRQHLQAWQLFTNWLTRRGGVNVNGTLRPLEVRVLDDRSQVPLVQAAFQQHVRDGLSLLVGPFGTPGSTVAANVANASGSLLLCPRASDLSVVAGKPTVWSVTPPSSQFTTCALEALQLRRPKTVAWIAENLSAQLSWCRPLASAVAAYGMNVTYTKVIPSYPDKNTTMSTLAELQAVNADVVFGCMQLQGCLDVVNGMQATSYFPSSVVLPACTTTQEWNALGEKNLFFTGTTPWLPTFPLKSTLTGWTAQDFATYYKTAYGDDPPFQAAAAFACLEVLVTIIEQANSTNVTLLLQKLRTLQVKTIYGDLHFDSNRQLALSFQAIQNMKVTTGPPPVVSPLAFAEAPMRYPMPGAVERHCLSRTPSAFGYTSAGVCLECPPGYAAVWNETAQVRVCFFCPPGFLYLGGSTCLACPPGSITIAAGQAQCTNCTAGTYAALEGQSQCIACAAGTFGANPGATDCQFCRPGTFNADVGQTLCRNCIAGTFATEEAERSCHTCAGGTYADADGMDACTPCSGGRITAELGARKAESCVCDKGSYWDGGACEQCPPLQSTAGTGATSKSDCVINEAARAMVAVIVVAVVVFPLMFWLLWARMKKKLVEAERQRLQVLQQQIDNGLKTIQEFQHPMVVVSASSFLHLSDTDLQAAHESAREKGLLKTFDVAAEVEAYRLKHPTCRIILFSYEWLSWVYKGPNPVQAAWMRRALALYCQKMGVKPEEAFVWLDVLSIPQVNFAVQLLAVNSLYTYAASADALIVIAPPTLHEGTGEKANLQSYKMRVWTRMELMAQVAAHGLESVYIASESALQQGTESLIEEIVDIFSGNMTCCRLKHKGRDRCDKETLVLPLLGVWYLLCGGAGPLKNSGAGLLHGMIQARIGQVFPSYFAFETEQGVKQRPLFGDLIPLLDKHLQRQKHHPNESQAEAFPMHGHPKEQKERAPDSPRAAGEWGSEIIGV